MLPEELQQQSVLELSTESSLLFHNLVAQLPGLKQNHHVCLESGRNELACWSPEQVLLLSCKSHGDHQGEKLLWLSAQFRKFHKYSNIPKSFCALTLPNHQLSAENDKHFLIPNLNLAWTSPGCKQLQPKVTSHYVLGCSCFCLKIMYSRPTS